MKFKFIFLIHLIIGLTAGREVDLVSFTPSRNSDSGLIDYGTLRVSKPRKNSFALTGDLELKRNIGNEYMLVFEIFLPNGGTLLKQQSLFCDYIKADQLVWADLENASNIPKNKPCPFPKGNYTIKNYVFNDSKIKAVPPGRYRAVGSLMDKAARKFLTQIEIVADVSL